MLSDDTFGHDGGEPGHIAARMRQALDKTETDRVGHIEEDHWDCRSSGMNRERRIAGRGDDNLWTKRDQLS